MPRIFSHAFVDQSGKDLAGSEKLSPLRIISSGGLCRQYYIKGFALSFKSGNAVANSGKPGTLAKSCSSLLPDYCGDSVGLSAAAPKFTLKRLHHMDTARYLLKSTSPPSR